MFDKIFAGAFLCFTFLLANTTKAQNRHFSLGTNSMGIGFGNSKVYSGIRFNLVDKNVTHKNGLLITGMAQKGIANGLNIGGLVLDSVSNGITLSPTVARASYLNGLNIGGLASGGDFVNGLTIGGLVIAGEKMTGMSLGIITIADTTQGLILSLVGAVSRNNLREGNGRGIIISTYVNRWHSVNGLCIGLWNTIDYQKGTVIGLINQTEHLKGVQIGLWNVAKNKKFLKGMPFVNVNFKKRKIG